MQIINRNEPCGQLMAPTENCQQ